MMRCPNGKFLVHKRVSSSRDNEENLIDRRLLIGMDRYVLDPVSSALKCTYFLLSEIK